MMSLIYDDRIKACFQELDIHKRIFQLDSDQLDRLLAVVQKARILEDQPDRFGADVRKRLLLVDLLLDLNSWFQQKQPRAQAIKPGGDGADRTDADALCTAYAYAKIGEKPAVLYCEQDTRQR